MRRRNTPH